MLKLDRALYLGLAAAALSLAGCTTNEACQDCEDPAACTDCEDPSTCEKCNPPAATLSESTAPAANSTCPISNEPVSAEIRTVAFNGQQVGFCCAGCATKFEALSDSEKAAKLAAK